MWKAITDPRQLESLSDDKLFDSVWPLLRGGNLATNEQRLERIRPNVRSACAELALEWQQTGSLNGRTVEFCEYLAACLGNKLREIDREQYPESYDPHRTYRPDREPVALPDEGEEQPQPLPRALISDDFSAALFQPTFAASELLPNALTSARVDVASQPPVLRIAEQFHHGAHLTGYRLARELGGSREEARNRPATNIHFLLHDLTPPNTSASGPA
jgi:hypothetical protein